MDTLTPQQRSWVMSRVKQRHTTPEIAVRSIIWGLGYRFRLHATELAGHPDIVFRSRRKVIFVHGCFWHRHRCRQGQRTPKTRIDFWSAKFARNAARDTVVRRRLRRAGWKVLIVWECETRDVTKLTQRIAAFLKR